MGGSSSTGVGWAWDLGGALERSGRCRARKEAPGRAGPPLTGGSLCFWLPAAARGETLGPASSNQLVRLKKQNRPMRQPSAARGGLRGREHALPVTSTRGERGGSLPGAAGTCGKGSHGKPGS